MLSPPLVTKAKPLLLEKPPTLPNLKHGYSGTSHEQQATGRAVYAAAVLLALSPSAALGSGCLVS